MAHCSILYLGTFKKLTQLVTANVVNIFHYYEFLGELIKIRMNFSCSE